MVSQLSVHSVFLKPTIHNKTIPCLSLTYRF
jgi:hypothetical protein